MTIIHELSANMYAAITTIQQKLIAAGSRSHEPMSVIPPGADKMYFKDSFLASMLIDV